VEVGNGAALREGMSLVLGQPAYPARGSFALFDHAVMNNRRQVAFVARFLPKGRIPSPYADPPVVILATPADQPAPAKLTAIPGALRPGKGVPRSLPGSIEIYSAEDPSPGGTHLQWLISSNGYTQTMPAIPAGVTVERFDAEQVVFSRLDPMGQIAGRVRATYTARIEGDHFVEGKVQGTFAGKPWTGTWTGTWTSSVREDPPPPPAKHLYTAAELTAARADNPLIGQWSAQDKGIPEVPGEIEFTPEEQIEDGKRTPVKYELDGNSITVIPKDGHVRTFTMVDEEQMKWVIAMHTFKYVRMK
jgi:hypothetical protein